MNAFDKALEVSARRTSLQNAVKEYLELPGLDTMDESCCACLCTTCYRRYVALEIVMKKLLEAVSE